MTEEDEGGNRDDRGKTEIEIERSHVGLRGRAVWPISGEAVIPASSTIHTCCILFFSRFSSSWSISHSRRDVGDR